MTRVAIIYGLPLKGYADEYDRGFEQREKLGDFSLKLGEKIDKSHMKNIEDFGMSATHQAGRCRLGWIPEATCMIHAAGLWIVI